MTGWWWRVCRAAWTRWDEWLAEQKNKREINQRYRASVKAWEKKYSPDWFKELRPEPEPRPKPGRRYSKPQHARPKNFKGAS